MPKVDPIKLVDWAVDNCSPEAVKALRHNLERDPGFDAHYYLDAAILKEHEAALQAAHQLAEKPNAGRLVEDAEATSELIRRLKEKNQTPTK
jgi:hypothetical protein